MTAGSRSLRALCLSLGCLAFLSCRTTSPSVAEPVASFAAFPSWLDRYLPTLVSPRIPAVQIALVEGGKTVYERAFGLADRRQGLPATTGTVFQVASLSKGLTAWGVLALQERGILDLDDPVCDHVTRWSLPCPEGDGRLATIRRVLSHTAGLNVHGYLGHDCAPDRLPLLEDSLSGKSASLFERLCYPGGLRMTGEPGTGFSYSGGGYAWIQLMMEECAPGGYARFMQDAVLCPLGMEASTFEYSSRLDGILAKPYTAHGRELPNYLFTEKAAAGLYSTAGDLAKVLNEAARLYADPDRPGPAISSESLKEIMTAVPAGPGSSDAGLGYFIGRTRYGDILANHGGANRGWRCWYGVVLGTGRGMVILTNSDAGGELVDDLRKRFYGVAYQAK